MDDKQLQDEQELAKVLAGVSEQMNPSGAQAAAKDAPAEDKTPAKKKKDDEVSVPDFSEQLDEIETPVDNETPAKPAAAPAGKPADSDLEALKFSAINDLRPLVDKLTLPTAEKFDTYLLLIRSTDDASLLQPAYQLATTIEDQVKKAQSLLDIIKEIDYFTNREKEQK